MAKQTLTLEDLKQATGPVGEPDSAPLSKDEPVTAHPYGDDGHGKGTSDTLGRLGAGKPITPGSGQ